nr:hypothetical protein [Candidatus Sigynarchaeota archaeon]
MRHRKNPPRDWRRIHIKGYSYRRRVKGRRKFKLIRVKAYSYWLQPSKRGIIPKRVKIEKLKREWIPCIEFEKRIVAMKKADGETVADMDRIYHSKRKTDVVNLEDSFVWTVPKRPSKKILFTTFRFWFWVYSSLEESYYLFTRTTPRGSDILDYEGARSYCAAVYDKISDELLEDRRVVGKKESGNYLEAKGLVAWTAYAAFAPVPFHGGRPKGSKNKKKRMKSRRRR